MPIKSFEVILYVKDQDRSRNFYSAVLALEPSLDVPGMIEFTIGELKIGLMPEAGIKSLLGPALTDPSQANGIPRCELYLEVDDPLPYITRATAAGATVLSPLTSRSWGHSVAYFADLDGHVLALAKED